MTHISYLYGLTNQYLSIKVKPKSIIPSKIDFGLNIGDFHKNYLATSLKCSVLIMVIFKIFI